ncbi:MAG TPA: hypothetical protein VMQ78_04565 [Candidatus Limnocylindria bacterium]|nr:hypothetical protein [Candidatus Limnocylindria bacterium]
MEEKARQSDREPTAQQADPRPIDDRTRLADEARATVEKNATETRKQRVPIASEPPTVYRP